MHARGGHLAATRVRVVWVLLRLTPVLMLRTARRHRVAVVATIAPFIWLPLLLVLAGVAPRGVAAQATCSGGATCAVAVTLRLPRPYVASLSLSDIVTTIPTLTATDMAQGRKDQVGPRITVKANAPFRLTVQSAMPVWSYAGAAPNPGKPARDLEWGPTATGPFQSLGESTTLWPTAGSAAPATAGQTVSLYYRSRWAWTTSPPGSYSIAVNLTITSP